jgi:hypothetical protein
LAHTILQLYVSLTEISNLLAQRNISWVTWLPNSLPLILGIIWQVGLVRLILEVAATVLLTPRRNEA